jgi:hypothetical protein
MGTREDTSLRGNRHLLFFSALALQHPVTLFGHPSTTTLLEFFQFHPFILSSPAGILGLDSPLCFMGNMSQDASRDA